MHFTQHRVSWTRTASFAALAAMLTTACAKRDTSTPANSGDSAAAPSASGTSAARDSSATSGAPPGITPVRGTVVSASDTALTVSTSAGDVTVSVQPPLHVYSRVPAKLSSVTAHSFVGVTSVAEPDGKQRATEIHIFPEALRGTGEGSYLMTPQGTGGNGPRSTMTNGTVQASPTAGGPPRMTNGTVASEDGGTLTVQYREGSQTIEVPSGVDVTALAPVGTKLQSGAKVVVLAVKQPDGGMKASNVVLAGTKAAPTQH